MPSALLFICMFIALMLGEFKALILFIMVFAITYWFHNPDEFKRPMISHEASVALIINLIITILFLLGIALIIARIFL